MESIKQRFYDAKLQMLTDSEAVYQWHEKTLRVPRPALSESIEQQVGQIGVLLIDEENGELGFFTPYVEQRLQRVMQCDLPNLWAWQIAGTEEPILVQAGIVPGIDGKVVVDDTRPLILACPPEFDDFCSYYNQQAEDVVRNFIADACSLQNAPEAPREDGYHSEASEEQRLATRYMAAVYGVYRRTIQ